MKRPLILQFLIFLLSAGLIACAHRDLQPPTFENAESLRGMSYGEVKAKLGEAADQRSPNVAYWFLSKESTYHPDPKPVLYQFMFQNDQLVEVHEAPLPK